VRVTANIRDWKNLPFARGGPTLQTLLNFTKGDIFASLTGELVNFGLEKRSEPWREYH
jgi:hypothetical protein